MIGIFDSGLGGLAVLKAIEERLPQYDYLYLGDNARAPYGDHSQETILHYTAEGLNYLFQRGCVLVVLACNTASAEALRKIQQEWLPKHFPDRNALGVIRPLAEEAARVTKNNMVGVMATRSTVTSGAYVRELKNLNKKITLHQQACRLLVPLIEEGFENTVATRMIVKRYVRPVKNKNVDTVILGCTHYGRIAPLFARYFGKNIIMLDSGTIIAEKLADYLARHPEYEKRIARSGKRIFATSEETQEVAALAETFLGRAVSFEQAKLGGAD